MKAKLLSAALAASVSVGPTLAACSTAQAASLVTVQIVDRTTGQPAALHRHDGRLYVAGNAGERYAVRITNRTGRRVLAVLSVDGVNAVTGETAGADQNGYVLAPYQSYDVPGWRKSKEEVAAFYFTSLPDSYAARTGRPRNVGVIGVAVWREQLPPPAAELSLGDAGAPRRAPSSAADTAASTPPASQAANSVDLTRSRAPAARMAEPAAPPAEADSRALQSARPAIIDKLGTGHGERVNSRVAYVNFEREGSQPAELVQIFYDSRANLLARGIIRDGSASNTEPDPFPSHLFVPDPRG